jgi:diguanylate cyclase (GGDEF)-like protein
VNLRRARRETAWGEHPEHLPFAARGRPRERIRRPLSWSSALIRVLTIAWAGAIVATLIDAFDVVPQVPLWTALGMTALLVAASFFWTASDAEETPQRRRGDEDDATHDPLTDLPDYDYFHRRLRDEFERSRRLGRKVSVVLIDVNNLTAVNKEYGVRAGDEVLRHVARCVDSTRRYNDVIARLGDDEFGVVLLDTGNEGVGAFIDRLEDRLAREAAIADVGGRSVSLWAGICSGNAVSTPAMIKPEAVFQAATESLNQAKQERERRRRTWLTA